MAVKEDTITEEDLANSLRTQYENFKQAYQEAAKPDYIDLDKDGNKKFEKYTVCVIHYRWIIARFLTLKIAVSVRYYAPSF